jgi:hypothetical protein
MPFEIISLGRGKYEVKNSETGVIHSKHTTKKNATAQVRLLNQVSGEGIKNELKAKLDEIASQSQSNFIKNEQERTKPAIIDIKHLVKPAGASVAPKVDFIKGGIIGISDHHIAKMGL